MILECLNILCIYRIEYDAYRTDLELMIQAPRSEATIQRLEEAQLAFEKHKDEFEKLRSDVIVKLKFLDENRVSINWCFERNIIIKYYVCM